MSSNRATSPKPMAGYQYGYGGYGYGFDESAKRSKQNKQNEQNKPTKQPAASSFPPP